MTDEHPVDAMVRGLEQREPGILYLAGKAEAMAKDYARQQPVVDAARAFVEHHLIGQPKTPGSLYPMTYAVQEQWHLEWDTRLDALINAVHALDVQP